MNRIPTLTELMGRPTTKELLKLAIKVIERTHENKVDLSSYAIHDHCKTLHCSGGWLAVSSEFNAFGLTASDSGYPLFGQHGGHTALNMFFRDPRAYEKFFATRGRGMWDTGWLEQDPSISDKTLALRRFQEGVESWNRLRY